MVATNWRDSGYERFAFDTRDYLHNGQLPRMHVYTLNHGTYDNLCKQGQYFT